MVGGGVVGLATTAALLDSGAGLAGPDVTCFEAVAPMSQRSTGSSRIFRLAHTDPVLVESACRARETYRRWSAEFGRELVSDMGAVGAVGAGGTVGAVIAGADVARWAAAMAAAGVEHEIRESVDDSLALPTKAIDGPCLLDPAGGVIDAAGVGEFLAARTSAATVLELVYRIEEVPGGALVWTPGGSRRFDVVVVAAGAGTCQLAAQVGLYTPSVLLHHLRLTFPVRDAARRPPALIDHSESWRPGFTTYQHLTAPGRWAVGAHFDPAELAWELGRERVVERSRRLTAEYVRENLVGIEDRPVDELYCNVTGGWEDGYGVVRTAGVIAVYGDNLFKLAPVIGRALAAAALDGSLPESTLTH